MTTMSRTSITLWALLAVSGLGCGDGGGGGKQEGACPALPANGPLYVVSLGVPSGDDFLGLLGVTSSLDADGCFDQKAALEIEPSWIFADPDKPTVYAA